ncbi:MAG: phosphoenolpyruvate mutase [Saccharofermentanales bacterium]
MKVLILNSGTGKRMGVLTDSHPKCMTDISANETILSRQLKMIHRMGIKDVIITTGYYDEVLVDYCDSLFLPLEIKFVKNPIYDETNYIYSIYCAREYLADDDIILMHGDLVFERSVAEDVRDSDRSCMTVSSTSVIPEKDFKAVIRNGLISKIGIEFFADVMAAQPLYKLFKHDWAIWLRKIIEYCEADNRRCYAENAFNDVSDDCHIYPLDVRDSLCSEIDTPDDLKVVTSRLVEIDKRTVYMSFSTDMIHSGHISIIRKAGRHGKLIVGVLSDEAVASYKRYPLMPFEERKSLFENITGVYRVIEQKALSYRDVLNEIKPTYVVHGDDWREGFQKPIRDEVIEVLETYGGRLIEYPYSKDTKYDELEYQSRLELSMPDHRRGRLKKLLDMKQCISVIEAHSGITGLIAEKTVVYQDGKAYQFDGMWVSSLCDSTAKGKPDIELVDMSSRLRTIDDIMEVTTKPIILDGDTGGQTEHFAYNVRTLERMGVSAVIIEDKTGLKKNSLFGTEVEQTQDSIENFSAKISAGKKAQRTKDFMIIARIESLILEKGMDDALKRAFAFTRAGADGIMIHSRKKEPDEIFEFVSAFRESDTKTPVIVVPTSFNSVTEEEFATRGVNIVIYANQLTRSGFPAMQNTARMILENHRAKEADDNCMSIKDILTLIPEE